MKHSILILSIVTFVSQNLFAQIGKVDSTFGNYGIVTNSVRNGDDNIVSAVLQPDGKIIVGGASNNGTPGHSDFALARYNSNGLLDISFGTGGMVTIHGYRY